jgi:hypothetical protein
MATPALPPCPKITGFSKFGPYYNTNASPVCENVSHTKLGVIYHYGKNSENKPMFTAMDYEQFKLSQYTLYAVTAAAGLLGVSTVVLLVMNMRRRY